MNGRIKIQVKCPGCKASLMDEKILIENLPSIQIKTKVADKIGYVYLSTLYGSYHKIFETVADVEGTIVECSCPHCFAPFPFYHNCECNAPIVGLSLKIGGTIKFCTRNGCKKHSLEFESVDDAFTLFQSQDQSGLA